MALNKIYTLNNTEIHTWAERDRLLVELRRKSDDKTLIEWRDEEVNEAVEDGFLPFGPDSRGHGNRELHVAALDYYNARFKKNPMKTRRNARISPADIAALRRILFAHTNPGARPGERDIATEIIKRRKNPRKKVKAFGPGKRWKTKKAMVRYMAKIRRLWLKRHKSGRKARR